MRADLTTFPDEIFIEWCMRSRSRPSHGITSVGAMNSAPTRSSNIPGFTVVSQQELDEVFDASQSAFYVLLGRHGAPEDTPESVLFVDYVDHFVDMCQQRIDALWQKHRVLITHVAVKLGGQFDRHHHNLMQAYERALALQELRHRLNPRFRRL
jgi:hypothetical protein